MPDAKLVPLELEDNGLYRYERSQWFDAGVDDFTEPPAQNPDAFLRMENVMPPQEGGIIRRWGYRDFDPKLDHGANIDDDEHPIGGGGPSSLDQFTTNFSASPSTTFSVGPVTPSVPDEWALLTLIPGIGTAVDQVGWTPFGGDQTIYQNFLGSSVAPFTVTGTQANTTWQGNLMTFYTNGGSPTLVQEITGLNSSFGANTTPGNSILVVTSGLGSSVTVSVADDNGNTYQTVCNTQDGSRYTHISIAQNINGGNHTNVIVTLGGAVSSVVSQADEITNIAGAPVKIQARNLYEYQEDTLVEKAIVATAADGTGIKSDTNKVIYWNDNGVATDIFIPAVNASRPRMVASRSYGYFVDGVDGDQQKWNIITGLSKWGIEAPTTAITVGLASGGGSTTYNLTDAATAVAGNTTYTGTALDTIITGATLQIGGFSNAANNGTFTVISSTPTTVTVNNPSGVLETGATATGTTENASRPTTFLNGWGPNVHVGSYEGGVDQGFSFGLDGGTTQPYQNPNNAVDGSTTTFAFATGQHTHQYFGCVWKFGTSPNPLVNSTLNVLSEVPVTGTDGQIVTKRTAGIWYTFDNGTNWTQVYDSAQRPKQYDTISVPDGQDLSQVQVMAFADSHDDMYHKVYDINIVGTTVGTGPIRLNAGRRYYEVFENSVTGHLSDLNPISASTGPVFGGAIPLSDLPVSSDPQVDKKIILATADGGDPLTLYFLQELDNATTTTIDTTTEDNLLQNNIFQETDAQGNDIGVVGNDLPPNGNFPIKHRGRLFMADGQFLRFSKSLSELTTSSGIIAGRYEESWPPENVIDVSEGAETIHGLFSDGVTLYIGTARHIRRLNGDSPENFDQPEIVFNETGLSVQDVWQTVFYEGTPVGTMWMTPDFRVIGSDFNTYQDIGRPIQTTLNSINPSAIANCWAQFFSTGPYNAYVLAIPTGLNTDPDTLCYYDTKIRKWYIWTLADQMISALFYMNLFGIPRWFHIGNTGDVWLIDPAVIPDRFDSTEFDPVDITSVLQTTWLYLGDAVTRKILNEVETMTTEVTQMTLTVEGASTQNDFLTPHTVITNQHFTQNFLGQWKNFIAANTTRDRLYRFTYQTTSDETSALSDVLLNYFSIEVVPLHRL